jgi:glycosyltransferase involved in cell wall biosynthesis
LLLNDPALARRTGAAGRERIVTEFSVERMVARYAELYEELIARGGASR